MTVTIKKYANRKLYDEEASAYLSMLELSDLAAKNPDIRVTCDRTGRDITLETLSRALYERLKAYAGEDAGVSSNIKSNWSSPFPAADLAKLIARVPSKMIPLKKVSSKVVSSKAKRVVGKTNRGRKS